MQCGAFHLDELVAHGDDGVAESDLADVGVVLGDQELAAIRKRRLQKPVRSALRIPYSAFPIRHLKPASNPRCEQVTASVRGVLGDPRVNRCSCQGYTNIRNTRE